MIKKIKNNLKRCTYSIILLTLTLAIALSAILLIHFFIEKENDLIPRSTFIIIYSLLVSLCFFMLLYLLVVRRFLTRKNKIINNSINHYIESLVSRFSIGIVIFHPNGNVLWASDFVEDRFGEKIVNESINFFNEDIDFSKRFSDFQTVLKKDEFIYRANFIAKEMVLVIQDITQEYSATHFYEIEKLVIGEAEIDNYQLYRTSFSDEEMFNVQVVVKNLFDELSKKYNFIFKQYIDGKFLILTNRDNLNKMIINDFKDLNSLNSSKIGSSKISLSIGFGADTSNYSSLMDMAKEALLQSQTRGGDQVTVVSSIEKTKRFGSKSELSVVKSRTKIKNIANTLKLKLQDEKIKNVVIYGHKYADLDALGASYALYEISKSFKKNAFIQNQTFDNTGQKAVEKYIKNQNEVFVSKSKISQLDKSETVIIIVDCAEETRVENPSVFLNAVSENIFIFDHHRVSKLDDIVQNLNVYIESTASSACEIITELIQFNEFHHNITKLGAQLLLNGIYLDTNQFKKAVSSRTFAAASLLEDWGASVEEVMSILKISSETNEKITRIISKSKEVKPGYWLSYTSEIIPIDVISMGADEILKIEGRKAAFVIAQLPKTNSSSNATYKLSARSIGINVQLIAEAVGGGGHFNAAAAVSDSSANESLETFVDNIIQAIISSKE